MTKNEYDYKRMLRQYEEIKKKMDEIMNKTHNL